MIGYNSHGQWASAREILKLEIERENYIDPMLFIYAMDPNTLAIWATKKVKDAVRYLRDADEWESNKPPTKEEREEIAKIDLDKAIELNMNDGEGGNLYVKPSWM